MEVHHAHAPSKEHKHFKHYLFEFLMLFLAVLAGFYAENIREHVVEHKKEKEYVQSIIEDLKLDTAGFRGYLENQATSIRGFDSVILLLNQDERTEQQQQRLYYLARTAIRYSDFPNINNHAYDQMKSSGNLRLIRKHYISDSISKYYFYLREIDLAKDQLLQRQWGFIDFEGEVFDGTVFQAMTDQVYFEFQPPAGNPALMTNDKKTINKLVMKMHYIISIMLYSKNFTFGLIEQCKRLIGFLKKEYHLE